MVRVLVTTDDEEYREGKPSDKLERYLHQIREAGGEPVVLTPARQEGLSSIFRIADAWLITGGKDLPPQEYGDTFCHNETKEIDPERLKMEKEIYKHWKQTQKPLLGICYGMQFLNVMAGGSLIQHLPDELGYKHTGKVPIFVEPSSRLARILKTERLKGECYHHQAVRQVAENYVASAFSEGGDVIQVVEAIEEKSERFWFGIQWHPERTPDDPATKRLFEAFIHSAELTPP